MSLIDLDIIQPCYNPLPGWEQSVWLHYQDVLKSLPDIKVNLIIVDDGSIKNVKQEAVDFLKERIIDFQYISYQPNKGKGNALRTGIAASRGRIQIYTDIDFPY